MVGGECGFLFFGQGLGERPPGFGIARVRHVAERQGAIEGIGEFAERVGEGRRRRHVGIAETEIVDVLGAVLFLEFDAGFEHTPDP